MDARWMLDGCSVAGRVVIFRELSNLPKRSYSEIYITFAIFIMFFKVLRRYMIPSYLRTLGNSRLEFYIHCPDDEGAFVEGNFHKIYRLDYDVPFPEPIITSDLRLFA